MDESGEAPDTETNPLDALYQRPGFKIRRAHQIVVSLLEEQQSRGGLTQTQYSALFVLDHRAGLDQISLAKLIGHDRSTTALVVRKLEEAGYIGRRADPQDRRRKVLFITPAGREAKAHCLARSNAAQAQMLAVFSADEQREFNRLLSKLVDAFNDKIRTPIETDASIPGADRPPRLSPR